MDHSLLHSHMDGSHNRGSPSIPPCNCHSGLPLLQAYRCSFRWRGRRESRLQSGRPLSPRGDSRMVCRSQGLSEVFGGLYRSRLCISDTDVPQCCANSHKLPRCAGRTLATLSSRNGSCGHVHYTYTSDIPVERPSVRQLAARVGRCREDCSAHSDHLQCCVCTHTSHGPHGWCGL